MSERLDLLRKRLLQQAPPQDIAEPAADGAVSSKMYDYDALSNGEQNRAEPQLLSQARHGNSSVNGGVAQYQLADAVAKVFEETKNFEIRLDELRRAFDQVEKLTGSADKLFAPLRSFHPLLSGLAESFAPVRAFQRQLAKMAETFEPMRGLHDQLAQVADSFQDQLAPLVRALALAKGFRDSILRLAQTFDPAEELHAEFSELHAAFGTLDPPMSSTNGASDSHSRTGPGTLASGG